MITEFILTAVFVIGYFAPTMFAFDRDHQHVKFIFFVNLVFGWVLLAYISLAIWALFGDTEKV